MRTQRIRRVASAMQTVLLTILATFVAGCATFTPPVRKPETIVDEKTLEARLKTYREIEERQQRRSASHVRIEGTDIREPPSLSPVTSRMYSFDLWFNADAVGDDAYKALLDHRVTIDVAGVPATFERVNYGTNGSTIHSSNMIRVKVPYAKGISSFNIIAYINDAMEDFESERMSRAEKARDCKEDNCENLRELLYAPNPYLEVKRVRVFNGDLTTRIYMLSKREVENAFGKAFAEAFYVGKAYFRNEQTEGKLIVHTTSLRARTLFRRRAITGPAIDISKLEKDIPAYDPLDTSRLRRDEARCVLRLVKEATGEQRPTVDDCLRRKADDPSIDKVKIELRDLANRLMRAKPHAADAAREKLIASARELVDEVR
ncbi:MAG TPA: hypothetical protein VJ724_04445, partial [Tahibacter sp.]|nr:hypothetical protein [Tahibacter sp.]